MSPAKWQVKWQINSVQKITTDTWHLSSAGKFSYSIYFFYENKNKKVFKMCVLTIFKHAQIGVFQILTYSSMNVTHIEQ